MGVGALGAVLVDMGGIQVKPLVYVAQLQVDMLIVIDFLQENCRNFTTSRTFF